MSYGVKGLTYLLRVNTNILGFTSTEAWRCVSGEVTTDVSKDCVPFILRGLSSPRMSNDAMSQ
jgi:hypothetical protein